MRTLIQLRGRQRDDQHLLRAPVVAFGTGGSGTRLVAGLLGEASIYLGPELNRAGDSMILKTFLRRWPESYLQRSRWIESMLRDPEGSMSFARP